MTINFQLSSLICCIVAVLAMFSAAALPAQPVWPRGTARVSGVVLDSSTRRPIVRTKICREVDLSPPHGKGTVCTSPDSVAGTFSRIFRKDSRRCPSFAPVIGSSGAISASIH